MGELGYQRGLNKFGIQRYVNNMEAILLEVSKGDYYGTPYRNGSLIMGADDKIYWVANGRKHPIVNPGTLPQLGFGMQDVRVIEDDLLKQLPEGDRIDTGGMVWK